MPVADLLEKAVDCAVWQSKVFALLGETEPGQGKADEES
jgi:hypothetical protein